MKVLIIEDNNIWQYKLQMIAEKAGLTVLPLTASLADAVKMLQQETPDLIIADICLQNDSVFDLFNNKEYKKIPTIFTTASQRSTDFKKAGQLNTYAFLVKPFHQHSLIATIQLLQSQKNNSAEFEFANDDIKITQTEIKRFYKLLGDEAILDAFNLTSTETCIIKQRWQELKTFADIGKDLKLSGQRIQRLYPKIINKIKTRIINNIPKYKDYLNFTNTQKNKLELLKNSVDLQKGAAKDFDLKTSIESIDELKTKWKNILWEKNIKTIGNLLQYSKKELSMFKGLGPFAVLEIEKALMKYGFKMEE